MNGPGLSLIASRSPACKKGAPRHPQRQTRNQASGASAVAKGERGRGHQVGFTRAEAVSRPRKVVERLISKKGISHPSCFFCKGGCPSTPPLCLPGHGALRSSRPAASAPWELLALLDRVWLQPPGKVLCHSFRRLRPTPTESCRKTGPSPGPATRCCR